MFSFENYFFKIFMGFSFSFYLVVDSKDLRCKKNNLSGY